MRKRNSEVLHIISPPCGTVCCVRQQPFVGHIRTSTERLSFPVVINCDSGAVYKIVIRSALWLGALISCDSICMLTRLLSFSPVLSRVMRKQSSEVLHLTCTRCGTVRHVVAVRNVGVARIF